MGVGRGVVCRNWYDGMDGRSLMLHAGRSRYVRCSIGGDRDGGTGKKIKEGRQRGGKGKGKEWREHLGWTPTTRQPNTHAP